MLAPIYEHPWDISPQEAIAIQRELAQRIDPKDYHDQIESVAGIDVGIKGGVARAAVAVLSFPALELIAISRVECKVSFPYVPGLLTFREGPVILQALAKLAVVPDVLMFDGQGYAHPRRMGIATHMGILLDHPSLGCAKSRLCGTHDDPGPERGSRAWLWDGEEIVGAVVRTRTNVRPVFVSVGHKMSLETAIDLVLRCGRRYRLPEPTRQAHQAASSMGSISIGNC
ncbi:MAG: endonuclease V [Chloroflexi bacterium RBG_13_56_8]|nr:MAG: endonuclease V [Chloroflexi bacterium RBG_13_56_8]